MVNATALVVVVERLQELITRSLVTDTNSLTHSLSTVTVSLALTDKGTRGDRFTAARTLTILQLPPSTRATLLLFIKCRREVEGAFCPWLLAATLHLLLLVLSYVRHLTTSNAVSLVFFSIFEAANFRNYLVRKFYYTHRTI